MNTQLLPVREGKMLPLPHFPAAYQCVIFRNWGLVPADRIARVLGTDMDMLRRCAGQLGLPEDAEASPDWLTKGYITIIHYNWHILTYEDLCILLDWPLEKLAYVLREDDFLEVKLGNFKPGVQDCRYRALTEVEQEQTRAIGRMVSEMLERLPPVTAKPFGFAPFFRMRGEAPMVLTKPRYEERFIYSYCALYGDTFLDKRLLEESFPNELLAGYASLGVTGVWVHIVLYTIVPYPFDPKLSDGWRERQEGMRYLTEKLRRYGLKLFLYFNEPRSMPDAFFREHPKLKGMGSGGYGTLCISRPEVQEYLRDSVAMLAENIPLLGGFFTITASENMTNCYSHVPYGEKSPCPRCASISHADSFALVNRLVWEGVSSVSDSIRVIAWSWGWDMACAREVIEKLPREVAVMNVSEQGAQKRIGDTVTSVLDYSISVEGPGEYARRNWMYAHRFGHKAYAKLQANNSWEIAAVPYLPVFEKTYRHIRRLAEAGEARPDGLMLSWSLGGYPSPQLKLISAFYEEEADMPSMEEVYGRMFPGADVHILAEAFHRFSEAFDAYPFHISSAYLGLQEHAPDNLLFEQPSGFEATMTGFPYAALEGWRAIFPEATYVSQLKAMSNGWREGLEILRPACEAGTDPLLRELWDCAEICDCHFRSMYLQCQYVRIRDGHIQEVSTTMEEILQEEESICLRVAAIQAHNPMIGYESANHYFYYRNVLLEKVISCRYLAVRNSVSDIASA